MKRIKTFEAFITYPDPTIEEIDVDGLSDLIQSGAIPYLVTTDDNAFGIMVKANILLITQREFMEEILKNPSEEEPVVILIENGDTFTSLPINLRNRCRFVVLTDGFDNNVLKNRVKLYTMLDSDMGQSLLYDPRRSWKE